MATTAPAQTIHRDALLVWVDSQLSRGGLVGRGAGRDHESESVVAVASVREIALEGLVMFGPSKDDEFLLGFALGFGMWSLPVIGIVAGIAIARML